MAFPAEFARIKATEDEYRRWYAQEPQHPALSRATDDYVLDLFGSRGVLESLKYRDLTQDEAALARLYPPRDAAPVGAYAVATTSHAAFESSWRRLTNGALAHLDWSNVVAAGGSVLAALRDTGSSSSSSSPATPSASASSDVDLFLYGMSEQEASRKVAAIYEAVCAASSDGRSGAIPIVRTSNAVTILGRYPTPHIQIVLRIYSSPAEVLMGFDIDCCTVAYTGSRVLLLPRARHALTTRHNVLDLSRRSLTYELRLDKYGRRGFGLLLPGVDLARVNAAIYTYAPSELHGLSKLLALERIYTLNRRPQPIVASALKSSLARKAIRHGSDVGNSAAEYCDRDHARPRTAADDEPESDYSQIVIPWGPAWPPNLVVAMMNRDDRSVFFGARRRDPSVHQHVLVSGIDGVLNGTSCWCSQCAAGERASGVPGVPGPIAWTTVNPGRQMLTGSFHPLPETDWQTQALDPALREQQVTMVPTSRSLVPAAQRAPQRPVFGKSRPTPKQSKPSAARGFPIAAAAKPKATATTTSTSSTAAAPTCVSPATSHRPLLQIQPQQPLQQQVQQQLQQVQQHLQHIQPPLQLVPSDFGPQLRQVLQPPQQAVPTAATTEATTFESAVSNLRRFAATVEQPPPPQAVPQAVPQSHSAKLLLLLARLSRDGKISNAQKSKLKDLVIARNAAVISALEVFEFDSDVTELVDTLQRICNLVAAPDAAPPQ